MSLRVERSALPALSRMPRAEQDRTLALIEERRRRLLDADDLWERYDPVYYVRGDPSRLDWHNPDYEAVEDERAGRLARLRSDPRLMSHLRDHYRGHPVDFITDWGCTFDPRNPEVGLPATVPFIPFPRQVEWIEYALQRWGARRRALTDKSRDSGVTWLAVALSCALCLFRDGLVIGFGSRIEDYVDKLGDPKSIFEKARIFLRALPEEFRGGWNERRHSFHMRLMFPATGSLMIGEGGDNIGRGNRSSLYFVDEAAHLERPLIAEASLSTTTNCRHDISTPHGLGNPFEQHRHSGKLEVFTFHWRDDPRKDDAWYAGQLEDALSPAIVAQEVDIDYAASVEGVLIPASWVQAALDAHERIGIQPRGARLAGLDVADEGMDRNAFCAAQGILVHHLEEWSGEGGDIFRTVQRAFYLCVELDVHELRYDADGLGAGVRGDARVIQEQDRAQHRLRVSPFRGSGAPIAPDRQDVKGRRNADLFHNRKAQAWWALRSRFRATYRHLVEARACDPDEVISISTAIPADIRARLASELSQVTYTVNGAGKILVDKTPAGTRSPNLADAVVIAMAKSGETHVALPGGAALGPGLAIPRRDRFGASRGMMPMRNRFARAR